MSTDTELLLLFAMLHLVALAGGGGLLLLALAGGDGHEDAHHERGPGGDQPSDPPRGPTGGPPLTVAEPARVRLREPARLADLLPPPRRRRTREPQRALGEAKDLDQAASLGIDIDPQPFGPSFAGYC